MTELYVDPDGLTAVSEVARRQHDHVDQVSSYISSTCSNFGAFSGVLNIFEGSYRSAVTTALDGMRDGQSIATKVQETALACRGYYLDSDREAYEELKLLYGDLDGFPPYEPPGSGNSTPGGPLTAPPPPGSPEDEDDPFGLPKLPPYVDGPLGRVLPEGEDVTNPVLDPTAAAKDAVVDRLREQIAAERYEHYLDQGMSTEDARAAATRDAETRADERVDRVTQQRATDAYDQAHDDAYDQALADGKTPEEASDAARDAGRDAATDQHQGDQDDTARRHEIGEGVGAYKDLYDTVDETIGNVQDLQENIEQLGETTDDLDDYDDYESGSGSGDRTAQTWGDR